MLSFIVKWPRRLIPMVMAGQLIEYAAFLSRNIRYNGGTSMTMRPDEIVAILRRQIEELDSDLKVEAEGTVLTVGDGIARVYGLQEAMAGELLEFPGNTYGMVLNLEH